MTTPPDDIDAQLARREPLFRRTTAADPLEPPAEIDRIVLQRARAALRDSSSDEASRRVFFTLNQWVMPLGLAATVVLALAVVVRMSPDAGAPAPSTVAETDLRRDARDTATAVATPAPAANAPVTQSSRAKPAGASRRASSVNEGRIGAQAALEAVREAELGNTTSAAPPAAGGAQPAAAAVAPAPPPTVAALADASEDSGPTASGGASLAMPSSQASALRNEATDVQASPELWYRKIVELRSKGQQRAADREWRALKARYPDFEAPPRTTGQ